MSPEFVVDLARGYFRDIPDPLSSPSTHFLQVMFTFMPKEEKLVLHASIARNIFIPNTLILRRKEYSICSFLIFVPFSKDIQYQIFVHNTLVLRSSCPSLLPKKEAASASTNHTTHTSDLLPEDSKQFAINQLSRKNLSRSLRLQK